LSAHTKLISADDHWIDLGKGKESPVLRFINDGTDLKLFEVSFYVNSEYYRGIYDALSTNYGEPKELGTPFRTRAGGDFTSTTSICSNLSSFITLTFRCRHLERYCLNYNHASLTKLYRDRKDALNAAAANKTVPRQHSIDKLWV